MTISNLTKMAEGYPNGKKTLWEKEKLLVTSNFSFPPQCFQKACFPGASKGVTVWEWVKRGLALILPRFHKDSNRTSDWPKKCGLANRTLFYFQLGFNFRNI